MKKIILSESQSKKLASILKEEETQVQQMPVEKKMNKPYCINPDKVLAVKKYLDNGFTAHDFERVGANGYPEKIKIITMNASNGQPLKPMYKDQLKDLLIDKFQKMFLDKTERELFITQVLNDWLNGSISVHGTLSTNMLKEATVSSEMVDERASETNTEPTDKQKEAGNYKMGHVSIKGMKISIENPKGSIRKFKNKDGNEGQIEMANHYGYFTNTTGNGKDGDAVDVFIGPHPDNFERVYVVDQKIDGEFDESKVMIGFYTKEEAKEAYMSNYDADWKGFWKITGVSLRTFKRWLYREHKQRKPFFDYVTIKKQRLEEGALNEEEYNEIRFIGRAFDEKSVMEIVQEIRAKGIEAYSKADKIYIMVERDRICPAYVDEVEEVAKRTMMEYMQTHSEQEKAPMYADSIAEEITPQDVYKNVQNVPEPKIGQQKPEEPAFGGWKRVRGKKGKYNLKNEETGQLLSDKWFDWIGYLVNGYAIVSMNNLGYNIINEQGDIVLPQWHEDILEPGLGKGSSDAYIIVDGDKKAEFRPNK